MDSKISSRSILMLSIATSVVIFLAFFQLHHEAKNQNEAYIQNQIDHLNRNLASEFELNFTHLLKAQERMAARWEVNKGTPLYKFEQDALQYLSSHHEIQALEWVNADGVVEWIVPLKGNEGVVGWDNKKSPERWRALQRARRLDELAFSDPINLIQGGKGFLVFSPILYDKKFDGFVLAVYRFEELIKSLIALDQRREENYIEVFFNGQAVFQSKNKPPVDSDIASFTEVKVMGQRWGFRFVPGPQLLHSYHSNMHEILLGLGALVSFLVGIAVFLGLHASRRKTQEEEVRRFLDLIFSNIPLLVIVKSIKEDRIVRINHAAELFFKDSLHDPAVNEQLEKIITAEGEVELPCSTDRRCFLECRSLVLNDHQGQAAYLLQIAEDVTLKKKERDKRKNLEAQLMQSQKLDALGKLAGGVAHDFNNILGGIMGYTSLLKSKFSEQADVVKKLNVIESSAMRGADLTKKMLGFARKGQYEQAVLSVNDVATEVCDLLSESMPKSIRLHINLNPDVASMKGDTTQIFQVILNVANNAIDAMPDGGELSVSSKVTVLEEDDAQKMGLTGGRKFTELRISDTGMGMPQDVIQRVFEPFFTTKEVGKGTGLGLAMVHGIMANHGGGVLIESQEGKGTTLRLFFPIFHQHETKMHETKGLDSGETKILQNSRVLIVDDEPMIRDLVSELLEPLGANIITAGDGLEAVEKFEEQKELDLVVLDVIMPNLDGLATYKKIKEIAPQTKVVFASGYSESDEIRELRKTGLVDFVQKPFKTEQLVNKVSTLIAKSK
ncbi:MAG: response regulator [Deltaproteobacteria bacterium]|nr:response regulator [Deltaproteobacteria bacterium]